MHRDFVQDVATLLTYSMQDLPDVEKIDSPMKEVKKDGVIIIKDVFKNWVEPLRTGFQKVLDNPSKQREEIIEKLVKR